MKRIRQTIRFGAAFLAWLGISCDVEYEPEVCDYNVRIEYIYNRENTTGENVLSDYIRSLSEYIFDGDGILYAVREVPTDECEGGFVSEQWLPPGDYSVITWGNKTTINRVNDERVNITRRNEMDMSPDNPFTRSVSDIQDNGDRLYYSYRTFRVPEYGISRVNAYMVHAHLRLQFRIVWKRNTQAPANNKDFYSELKEVPSQYNFMPEFVFNGTGALHDPANDRYEQQATERYLYIPTVYGITQTAYVLNHRCSATMNDYREVNGELVAYRLRNDTGLTLNLRSASQGEIMRDVHLGDEFFRPHGIILDRNLRQEFAIIITIDGDNITVAPLEIADWNEGGTIGV